MFSQSSSSKISGSRRRLPMDEGALGFRGHAKLEVLGDDKAAQNVQLQPWLDYQRVLPFCLFLELPRACRRGVLISPKGWRVEVAISTDLQRDEWRREKSYGSKSGVCERSPKRTRWSLRPANVLTIHGERGPSVLRVGGSKVNRCPSNSNGKWAISSQQRSDSI